MKAAGVRISYKTVLLTNRRLTFVKNYISNMFSKLRLHFFYVDFFLISDIANRANNECENGSNWVCVLIVLLLSLYGCSLERVINWISTGQTPIQGLPRVFIETKLYKSVYSENTT